MHRDIKAANIMLNDKGDVKIMDFGLAKVRGGPKLTKEQSTLGTASYMSPEQTRGEEVDNRTDIFSLGVLIYEMLTGQLPFKGDYEQAITYSILNEAQEPITALRTGIPMELERIVNKCLQKEQSARYQGANDLFVDLRQVNKQMTSSDFDIDSKVPKSKPQAPSSKPHMEQKSFGKRITSGLGIFTIFVIATVVVWKQVFGPAKVAIPFQNMQMSRLTSTGKAALADISPDGKYVVHSMTDQGKSSLWVRQIVTGSDVQIIPPAEVVYHSTAFSPDGNYIFYVMASNVTPIPTLYRVPTLGGRADKILTDIDSQITFSPDGRQIAFIRQLSSEGEEVVMVANIDGSNLRKLTSRKEPEFFVSESINY